jgi:hypothetical protein
VLTAQTNQSEHRLASSLVVPNVSEMVAADRLHSGRFEIAGK